MRAMNLIRSKKGISTDMLINVGILIVAAVLFVFTINIFYDSVETSVKGDPSVGAHMIGTYMDYAHASSNPIKIYHEVPSDLMGNPGYGTLLYNPETCTVKANKYPQDYISEFILNSGFGEITIEEGLTAYALSKWRKKMVSSQGAFGAITKLGMKEVEEEVAKRIRDEGIDVTTTEGKAAARKIQSEAIENAANKAASRYKILGGTLGKLATGEATEEAMAFASKKGVTGGAIQPLTNFAETNPAKATQFMESEGSEIVARAYNNGYAMDEAFEAAGKSSDDFVKYLAADDSSARLLLELSTYNSKQGGMSAEILQEAIRADPEAAAKLMRSSDDDFVRNLNSFANANPDTKLSRQAAGIKRSPEALKNAKSSFNSMNKFHTEAMQPLAGKEGKGMRKMLASSDVAQKAMMNPASRSEIAETFVKPIVDDVGSDASKLAIKHASKRSLLGKPLTFSPIINAVRKKGFVGSITTAGKGIGRGVLAGGKFALWTAPKYVLTGQILTDSGKFMFNNVIKKSVLGKVIFKETGESLAKTAGRQLPAASANKLLNCEAIGGATFGIGAALCYGGKALVNGAMASLEYFFTYLPIRHFIERSQDATNAVDDEWGEFSCHLPQKPIKVAQPNCESGPAINKIEVVETLHNNKVVSTLRDIPLVSYVVDFLFSPIKALEALLQTPSSKPELDSPKEYDYIENSDADCSNSHNYLLSNDAVESIGTITSVAKVAGGATAGLLGGRVAGAGGAVAGYEAGSRAVEYSIGHPESLAGPIKAPFWGCVALAAIPKVQDWTPGCLTVWTAGYVSMWADPDLSTGQIIALETITGFLAGPAGFAAINIYLVNPIDSTNFFPYLSKSGGMVDTDNYYYIEDPYVISVTKEFDEEGNSEITLDKEI